MIAVHGVADSVAWDEDVAIDLGHGHVGDYETVAIVVEDQTTSYFVAC